MTEDEAHAEATRLNKELAAAGGRDARRYFYLEVEQPDGQWTVEKRREEPSRMRDLIWDFFGDVGPS